MGCFCRCLVLVAALALVGCAARPTPTPSPAPTTTPTPAPTATLAPTRAAAAPVSITGRRAYRHPSGRFTLAVPLGWDERDESQPDEIIMVWTDAGRNGAVIVNLFEADPGYDEARLGAILQAYLERSFGQEEGFGAGTPEADADGRVGAAWGFTRDAGGVQIALTGVSRIAQRDGTVAIVSVLLPAAQRDALEQDATAILTSLTIEPE